MGTLRFDVEASGQVDVTNETHNTSTAHEYVVMLDTETGDALTCTYPHHVCRRAHCTHMAGVEDATADGSLDAFPSKDSDEDDDEPRVTGPHIGFDKHGNADHRYWQREECGRESTDKHVLGGDFGNCC